MAAPGSQISCHQTMTNDRNISEGGRLKSTVDLPYKSQTLWSHIHEEEASAKSIMQFSASHSHLLGALGLFFTGPRGDLQGCVAR